MQKAIVVRTTTVDGKELTQSFEVDPVAASTPHPLRKLLAAGWEVVHVCPMNSDDESACLLILDKLTGPNRPAGKRDASLVDVNHPSPWLTVHSPQAQARASADWDGDTIPLDIFRVDGPHGETGETSSARPR